MNRGRGRGIPNEADNCQQSGWLSLRVMLHVYKVKHKFGAIWNDFGHYDGLDKAKDKVNKWARALLYKPIEFHKVNANTWGGATNGGSDQFVIERIKVQ